MDLTSDEAIEFAKLNAGVVKPSRTSINSYYLGLKIFEDVELNVKYLEKVMPYVYQLWGRAVHIERVLENKPVVFTYDGKGTHRKFL
jgi:spore cortex formation protein SpoVR/YcgB (stage V sporulation)